MRLIRRREFLFFFELLAFVPFCLSEWGHSIKRGNTNGDRSVRLKTAWKWKNEAVSLYW